MKAKKSVTKAAVKKIANSAAKKAVAKHDRDPRAHGMK